MNPLRVSSMPDPNGFHPFRLFKIYDAGDFSLLSSMPAKPGEAWAGGDFLATDRVIVWNTKGVASIFRLPTKYVNFFNYCFIVKKKIRFLPI